MSIETLDTQQECTTSQECFWGWTEAVIIAISILMVGFALQWRLSGMERQFIVPQPWPWVLIGGLTLLGLLLGVLLRRQIWMRWLSGSRFAIVAIALVALLSLIGTFIVQDMTRHDLLYRFGFRNLFTSVPFLLAALLMYVNLVTVLGRRLIAPRPGNLGFILNHAGMILVMVAMIAGPFHFVRAQVTLTEGMPIGMGFAESGFPPSLGGVPAGHTDQQPPVPIGATLMLNKFSIEWYPPQLQVADMTSAEDHQHAISKQHVEVRKGDDFTIEGVNGCVLDYIPNAGIDHEKMTFVASAQFTGVTAAQVEIDAGKGKKETQWLVAGQNVDAPSFIAVNDTKFLYMSNPMPRAFRSQITVTPKGKKPFDSVMEVNKPLRVGDWWLYQSSYKPNMFGGTDSILTAVKDPVLPLVYVGLLAILLGSFVTFWAPKRAVRATANEEVCE